MDDERPLSVALEAADRLLQLRDALLGLAASDARRSKADMRGAATEDVADGGCDLEPDPVVALSVVELVAQEVDLRHVHVAVHATQLVTDPLADRERPPVTLERLGVPALAPVRPSDVVVEVGLTQRIRKMDVSGETALLVLERFRELASIRVDRSHDLECFGDGLVVADRVAER